MDAAQIIRDLRVFSDPATEVTWVEGADLLSVKMTRGDDREYVFDLSTGAITSRHPGGKRHATFAALIASDEFIDIRSFKATQRRILSAKDPDNFLDPEGTLGLADENERSLNLQSFRSAISRTFDQELSIMLLDGPAGIGKTSLIERMVFERANASSPQPPLLHVTSAGSRLTDLNKALAHATQILRSNVTFDQVPILARLGVLQVAIDGFDELVDPDGYKDAWFALREFLHEVGSGGPIILSGRDTFFDQQSFEARLADRIPNLRLHHARLSPVSPNVAKDFLRANYWSQEDIEAAQNQGWFKRGSYFLRPFFLRQIGEHEGWDALRESYGSPPAFLAARFVSREAKLVVKMTDLSEQDAERALWDFYGIIVEDMAMQESDSVDESYLGLACETAFESYIDSEQLAKLAYKAASFGLLESDGNRQTRRFPHSELQNQFFAKMLISSLEKSPTVSAFFRRGLVSMTLLEAFSDSYNALDEGRSVVVSNRLEEMLRNESFGERLIANVVAILLATLSRPNRAPLSLEGVSTNDARFIGTTECARLIGVSFAHLDVRGADCTAIDFSDCVVNTLTVDNDSIFGATRPTVTQNLQIEIDGVVKSLRAPHEIDEWLAMHSIGSQPGSEDHELPLVRYFDRLCRKFIRQRQIRSHTSDEAYFLLQDPHWNEVRAILGDRLQEDSREARGPKNTFFRVVQPESLLSPGDNDQSSRQIRAAVVKRARELSS